MSYSVKALGVYLVVMAFAIALNELTTIELLPLHISLLGLFMFGSSTLVHHLTMKASEKNPRRFPAYFMGVTGLKLMAYIMVIAVYAFIFRDRAVSALVFFLIMYLLYTILEVVSVLSTLKK